MAHRAAWPPAWASPARSGARAIKHYMGCCAIYSIEFDPGVARPSDHYIRVIGDELHDVGLCLVVPARLDERDDVVDLGLVIAVIDASDLVAAAAIAAAMHRRRDGPCRHAGPRRRRCPWPCACVVPACSTVSSNKKSRPKAASERDGAGLGGGFAAGITAGRAQIRCSIGIATRRHAPVGSSRRGPAVTSAR